MTGGRRTPKQPRPPDLPGLTWRRYRPGDLAAVVELHVRAFAALGRDVYSEDQIAGHEALIRSADYPADLDRSNVTVALLDGEPVATAGWLPLDEPPKTARIRKVFVDPALARRGLAAWLVGYAEREARDVGYPRYFVRANLNAVPLYERLGYAPIEPGTMKTPTGAALPVLFMRKA
jgi:GNAT superfamily N-acetyltransferase